MARARASTTSARPPVLAHGSHSADRKATRRPTVAWYGPGRASSGAGRTRRPWFGEGALRYHARRRGPVGTPSVRAATFPPPPRLEGLRRLAYNLHWAWSPRTRNLWSLIDRTAWNRYRNPVPVISGPTEWSRLLDDEKF